DAIGRAVGKTGAHRALAQRLSERLAEASGVPAEHRTRLGTTLDRAIGLAETVARGPAAEPLARKAPTAPHNAVSAVLLAYEGVQDARDARRLLLSRMVLEHRLTTNDPLAGTDAEWEAPAIDLLLADASVPLEAAQTVVAMPQVVIPGPERSEGARNP